MTNAVQFHSRDNGHGQIQTAAGTNKRTCIFDRKWDVNTMVSQIQKYTLDTLSPQEGRARTHRSCTIKRDVNLQPEITSVARGVGELKRKERNKNQWVLSNAGRRRGIHTA